MPASSFIVGMTMLSVGVRSLSAGSTNGSSVAPVDEAKDWTELVDAISLV